jgi:hypothetical protein
MKSQDTKNLRIKDVRGFVMVLLRTGWATANFANKIIEDVTAAIQKEQAEPCGACKGDKKNYDEDGKVQPGVCPFCKTESDEKDEIIEGLLKTGGLLMAARGDIEENDAWSALTDRYEKLKGKTEEKDDPLYCDNCGIVIFFKRSKPLVKFHEFTELPYDIESARKGESGIVCEDCHVAKI